MYYTHTNYQWSESDSDYSYKTDPLYDEVHWVTHMQENSIPVLYIHTFQKFSLKNPIFPYTYKSQPMLNQPTNQRNPSWSNWLMLLHSSKGFSSSLSVFNWLFAYKVKKIVVATVAIKPTTLNMICGPDRDLLSYDASARASIKIPLHQKKSIHISGAHQRRHFFHHSVTTNTDFIKSFNFCYHQQLVGYLHFISNVPQALFIR